MTSARYALVTGASRGIGSHFARALAARSWNLIIVSRAYDRLQQLASELSEMFHVQVVTIALDLTASGAALELSRQIADKNLEVELLVNNAGHGGRGKFSDLPIQDQSNSIVLNTLALTELTHALLPGMIARRRGGIINVSSTAGFQPMPYAAIYAATKAFVTSFSMALAEEVRADGVTVVTLCPGPTQTESTAPRKSPSRLPGGRQPASEVVEEALKKVESHGGLVVPRLLNKVMAFSNRLMPLQTSAKIVARAMGPRESAQ
jgi:short-subunit dehydrogenase